ncbi:MAG: hypothetical protein K0S47_4230 [Herbinix sp.]|jgi:hypothetical protein|nr:hypothetical protein [Herbinix sp.]
MCEVRIYDNEDQILKDLIETNIIQRGIGNPNPVKLGRCIKELERINGVRSGSANPTGTTVSENISFTQKDLADKLGMEVRTMQNYKKLTELIPEIVDLIDTGIVTPTTALAIAKNMKPRNRNNSL